jgi:hypothetical protein
MRRAQVLATFVLLVSFVSQGCDDDDDCDDCQNFPVFIETERNDDPATANDFGLLVPGDHFFIDGTIRDDGLDEFDGFRFTSGDMIHVDFQLFIDDPASDLDVCLYDPLLDVTVDCFATPNNPEQGGVDVVSAGFDFHLVVESFLGLSGYSLEIIVQPLFAATASGPDDEHARPAVAAIGVQPLEGRAPAAPGEYSLRRREERTAKLEILRTIEIDRESGLIFETIRVR